MKAEELIAKTKEFYNLTAKEWNLTRVFPGPLKKRLISRVKAKEKFLDIGCGNAFLYDILAQKSIYYVGLDFSKELLKIARKRAKKLLGILRQAQDDVKKPRFVLGEATKLPFKDKTFDWVFSSGVYHHLPTIELRQQAIDEAWRVLKPGGKLALTVWNLFSKYVQNKYKLKKGALDVFIPWKATPGRIIRRYIHIFRTEELRSLLKIAGFKKFKISIRYLGKEGRLQKNLVAIAQK